MTLLTGGCRKKPAAPPAPLPADTVFTATYETAGLPESPLFQLEDTFHLKADLPEISGLVRASDTGRYFYWGEEDSGNPNAIYLLDTLGRLAGTRYLSGVLNRDWEDIAAGPGPAPGFYLYLGDIGDNLRLFPFITVYRFQAAFGSPASWKDSLIKQFDALNLLYPDGHHDAEALMVDPETKDLFILTKESPTGVYVASYPQNPASASRLVKLGTIPLSTVTAADISMDGSGILIKNYDGIYYWKREKGQSVGACLQQPPVRLRYQKEPQGEAIAWDPEGKGFYTISEKVGSGTQVLYHYAAQ